MNRAKSLAGVVALIVLSGCAGPRYLGTAIEEPQVAGIVIVNDVKTRPGFQEAMESWLNSRNYNFEVIPDGSEHDPRKLTLEYIGYWSWDLAMYLDEAYIEAFRQGESVAKIEFKAPNSLNLNKIGNAEQRIFNMMELLFGEISIEEANERE